MISNEILNIILILSPGIISFIIIETLIPYEKIEFNRVIAYVTILNAMVFVTSSIFFKISSNYYENKYHLIMIIGISIVIGFFISWVINKKYIFKIMSKLNGINFISDMEVWDDFFEKKRENSIVVVRDIANDLMYYGIIEHFSVGTTSKFMALHLIEVDVFRNSNSKKLYKIEEVYLPYKFDTMTVEFPKFN